MDKVISCLPCFGTWCPASCNWGAQQVVLGWDVWPFCCGADGMPDALRQCSLHIVVVLVNTEPSLNSPNTIAHCRALEKWHHMQNSGQTGKLDFAFGKEGNETKLRNELLKNFLRKTGLSNQFCQGGSLYVFLLGILNNLILGWNCLLLCIMFCSGPFNAVRSGRRKKLHHKFFI